MSDQEIAAEKMPGQETPDERTSDERISDEKMPDEQAPDENTPDKDVREMVVNAIKAIKKGPRAMRMYMEMCAKCGTCASVCPVYFGKGEKRYNPAERTDIIRRIYRKHCTVSGGLFGKLAGAEDFDPADIDEWEKIWYECT
ncbi:MAG: 4Fe-4S dicluster domain-containing protein, partial [Planctomycetota bacterium]